MNMCLSEKNIDTADLDDYDTIIADPTFNPDDEDVHHARIRVRFSGSPCTLVGADGGNGEWSTIGTVDLPQTTALNACDEGTLVSGDCFPFGPIRINAVVGFMRYYQQFELAGTDMYINPIDFDYFAYYRDKDAYNATNQDEGVRPGGQTCLSYASSSKDNSNWQCQGGNPWEPTGPGADTDPRFQCDTHCDATSGAVIEACAASDPSERSLMSYVGTMYGRDIEDTRFKACNTCVNRAYYANGDFARCCDVTSGDPSVRARYTDRSVGPGNIGKPTDVYTYYWDPEEQHARWEEIEQDANYDFDPTSAVCDPKQATCRFNYFKKNKFPRQGPQGTATGPPGGPDPNVQQWVDPDSMTCHVPPPRNSVSQSSHYIDPQLYRELAKTGPDGPDTEGTWYAPLGSEAIAQTAAWTSFPTCVYCEPVSNDCAGTASYPDYDRGMTAKRFFNWNVGPKCQLFVPKNDPVPLWNFTISVRTTQLGAGEPLFDMSYELTDADSGTGDGIGVGAQQISENGKIAVVVKPVFHTQTNAAANIKDVGGLVHCSGDFPTQDSQDTGRWSDLLEEFPWFKNHDDNCEGCTPLQQDGKDKRGLWYTVAHGDLDETFTQYPRFPNAAERAQALSEQRRAVTLGGFSVDNNCGWDEGPHPGQYGGYDPVLHWYCGDNASDAVTDARIEKICRDEDQNMCRPRNDGSVVSPCYVAAAFDQFYTDYVAWKESGATDDTRPAWHDYEAARFMPFTYSPYPSPNMWTLRREGAAIGKFDAFDKNRPTLVYEVLETQDPSDDNPYRVFPADLEIDIYVTQSIARPGPGVAPANLTYTLDSDDISGPCPYTSTATTVCTVDCQPQTNLFSATTSCPANIRDRCNINADRDALQAECAYASFFVDKTTDQDAEYILDFSACYAIGLDAFFQDDFVLLFGVDHIINNQTSFTLTGADAAAGIIPSPTQPFEVFFRLVDSAMPISPSASCSVSLLYAGNGTQIQLSELTIRSAESTITRGPPPLGVGFPGCPDTVPVCFDINSPPSPSPSPSSTPSAPAPSTPTPGGQDPDTPEGMGEEECDVGDPDCAETHAFDNTNTWIIIGAVIVLLVIICAAVLCTAGKQ
jgi:hypothetical protein